MASSSFSIIRKKTQTTVSICLVFLLLTSFLFYLASLEPTFIRATQQRRNQPSKSINGGVSRALRGMGELHLRGTKAMQGLIICHVPEDTVEDELKVFIRVLLRSGVTSHVDVAFLFHSILALQNVTGLINDETTSFVNLLSRHTTPTMKPPRVKHHNLLNFNATPFFLSNKNDSRETFWGKRNTTKLCNDSQSECPRHGSVLSFDAGELDPENSLAGFMDQVPFILRRWACYPLLLGRTRRNFKHAMLVDVKDTLVTGDALFRVGHAKGDSVQVIVTKHRGQVVVVMGGIRGIRRLVSSVMNEIVRSVTLRKKNSLISEGSVLRRLIESDHFMKSLNLMVLRETVPDISVLLRYRNHHYIVLKRDDSDYEVNMRIMKTICASEIDSLVYKDCQYNTQIYQ